MKIKKAYDFAKGVILADIVGFLYLFFCYAFAATIVIGVFFYFLLIVTGHYNGN